MDLGLLNNFPVPNESQSSLALSLLRVSSHMVLIFRTRRIDIKQHIRKQKKNPPLVITANESNKQGQCHGSSLCCELQNDILICLIISPPKDQPCF